MELNVTEFRGFADSLLHVNHQWTKEENAVPVYVTEMM